MLDLAEQAGPDIVSRINYPHVHTIYLPNSQLAFALGYKLKPWSLTAWKAVLLSADIATLLLLLVLLKHFDRSLLWAGIYWWNPLSITETLNAGHMDMLLLPCLVAIILFMSRLQSKKAVFMLSIATAVKLWPAILLAPLIRALPDRKLVKIALVVFFSLVSLALLSPQLVSAWYEPAAGVRVYSESWQRNAFLFDWIARSLNSLPIAIDAELISRLFIATLIIGLALFPVTTDPVNNSLTKKSSLLGYKFVDHSLVVIAALFLLSPTGYPWYAAWMLPLLVLRPNPALLILTATLPLYDIRYYLAATDQEAYWLPAITALQFAPTCIWLIW